MTSQTLVASVCVDYLSHPLSAEHLLVCYQQITRQIAHAPLSAKDAASSFQHQSQALLELLGQHQNLAIPTTKERPAPVGCQSQLKRMQNALWRRSSQSSLAKDVALVHPESLNWQKECDVLWLYGPLYEFSLLQQQEQRKGPSQTEWMFEHLNQISRINFESPPLSPNMLDPKASAPTVIATATTPTTPESPTATATAAAEVTPIAESTTVADAIDPLSVTTSSEHDTAPIRDAAPLELPSDSPTEAPEPTEVAASAEDTSTASPPAAAAAEDATECSNALLRPTKSALKRQRTRNQVFEELRAFTQSPQYVALTESLAISFESTSTLSYTEGCRSEPISPVASGLGPTFLLPIFPSPTKYHFRGHDRRRASFPKSASQPNRLNVNVNVNMSVNMQMNGSSIRGDASSTGSSIKQLRFSLEVQELVFLPTSPPFRISRAKPTRAHSDPAIQMSTCSSFIAPSHVHEGLPQSIYPGQGLYQHPQLHNGNLVSTAAASASLFENTTTTFIRVQAQDPSRHSSAKASSTRPYLHHDDDDEYDAECHFVDDSQDEYLFEDCHESDDDEDDDEFNGISGGSHRLRLSTKDAIIARRGQTDENRRHPGVLWQVYTAVTGVKELIAWYGSMVYHSSSL